MDMERRPLGSSGIEVSVIGLGCNNLGRAGTATESQEGTDAVVEAALDAGVSFFDTADIYGREYGLSERRLGAALAGRRDEAVITTKFGYADVANELDRLGAKGSRAYLRAALEGSLERLGVDDVELYQLHTPDPMTPIEETLEALVELVEEGRIRAYGHSNFSAGQIAEAASAADRLGIPPFVSAQNEYNLLARGAEADVLPAVAEAGLGFMPYLPLANGLFTGKFTRTDRPADSRIARQRPHIADEAPWDAMDAFRAFADERGISMLEATFGWFLSDPRVTTVIAGATRPDQIRANAAAGSGWRASADERATIDRMFPVA